jgi:hypothetical protein
MTIIEYYLHDYCTGTEHRPSPKEKERKEGRKKKAKKRRQTTHRQTTKVPPSQVHKACKGDTDARRRKKTKGREGEEENET